MFIIIFINIGDITGKTKEKIYASLALVLLIGFLLYVGYIEIYGIIKLFEIQPSLGILGLILAVLGDIVIYLTYFDEH